ncbi:peptidoglycan binding domain-containing protein [Clostridium tertium]|uniref:L,D-transpeptidase family protein n=1 Tax=Clostridium TaxID=1485 RepID=UPI000DD04FA4|nr:MULTISPECIES: L,D-transpeptidase family protein [Clostridium]MBS5307606.1 L,D-transpeptidase/peptidoglycan binding protein [Clostridium sp.]MDB1924346.1 peptidoglycan binding domain-containing protein [Clostridium tertium]MDB1927935.1 peptidoglycan binding domain-containing protein [Clostridium tertium]MDB1931423.1 peptidoglycan binding domain-containing protein [Clostridium tertium]MDB1931822.1 peptidoglycan binding domain-containing protein [Clostridium tertium]
MKRINLKEIFKNKITGNIIIIVTAIIFTYLLIAIFFTNHFFFNTEINGINLSLKSYEEAPDILKKSINDYKLQIIERDGKIEEILGKDIGLQYNEKNSISNVQDRQASLKWIVGLIKKQNYNIGDLVDYNNENLNNKIKELDCLNKDIIEPKNVGFKYLNGSYELIEEVYGNKVKEEKLYEAIENSILNGEVKIDLNEKFCYENPEYTVDSEKAMITKDILNKYISTKITYLFGDKSEVLDGSRINEWLSVDDNLEVIINEKSVKDYVLELSAKYNTVGIARNFKSSTGKMVEVKGGYYGWKINYVAETKMLLENIKLGAILEKEPIYTQKGLNRDEDDIGDTYVEINLTSQHLWFYKNGKLITQGDVVTGDPGKGYSTKLGTYMLNYKQKEATLRGPNYEAKVTYWMPFNGNIGIHDASWRYSFGGKIYKGNGTHGCVNSPSYLAKTIFENIDEGTPVICYEE